MFQRMNVLFRRARAYHIRRGTSTDFPQVFLSRFPTIALDIRRHRHYIDVCMFVQSTPGTTTREKEGTMPRTKKSTIPTKTCTKSGAVLPATPEFFYRDKSQKDGLSPWSKDAERAYNKAYRAGLGAAKAPRKGDIPTNTRPGKTRLGKFETAMKGERVARGRAAKKTQASA